MKRAPLLLSLLACLTLASCSITTSSATSAGSSSTDSTHVSSVSSRGQIYYGKGVPSAELGEIGDVFIDIASQTSYVKEASGWVRQGGEDASSSVSSSASSAVSSESSISSSSYSSSSSISSSSSRVESSSSSAPVSSVSSSKGYVYLTGHGVPSATLGEVGDKYLDLNTLDTYIKTVDGWVKEGNALSSMGQSSEESQQSEVLSSEVSSQESSVVVSSETSISSSEESSISSQPASSEGEPSISSEISSSEVSSQTSVSSASSEVSSQSSISSSSAVTSSSSSSQSSYSSSSSSSSQTSISSQSSASSQSSGLSSVSIDSSSPWQGLNFNTYGTSFLNALNLKITQRRTASISYSACLDVGAKAAAYPNSNSNTFIPFYHEAKDGEQVTTSSCNREHTWPNSRGSGKSGAGSDPFIIRPTLSSENSSRGNKMYGLSSDGGGAWDPASCGYEAARGESARVILYAAVAWKDQLGGLTNNVSDSTTNKTMGKLSRLLEWNKKYPVTAMEMQINNYLDSRGYGRNPFVDYPDFADYIWDVNGIRSGSSSSEITTKYTYNKVALGDIKGKGVAIVTADAAGSSVYYSMTSTHKTGASGDLPWYIQGSPAPMIDGQFKTDTEPTWFTVEADPSGNYEIKSKADNKVLWAYIDGTHYSIQFGEPTASAKSCDWKIEASGAGYSIYAEPTAGSKVYLEYYNGSFCGYSKTAPSPFYFYA